VLPTNLKAGGSRRGGSKYTPSTLPRPWIYPGTPQLDADALSSLRDKLQVCVKRQPARCDAMQEPARSASLTAAPTPPPHAPRARRLVSPSSRRRPTSSSLAPSARASRASSARSCRSSRTMWTRAAMCPLARARAR
jgi:hypothetical protein